MLDDFLEANREAIIARARKRVAARTAPHPTDAELVNGIPLFLEQLGIALRLATSSGETHHEEIERSAAKQGHELYRAGLTVAQVVHGYGDVCQVMTELAVEQHVAIAAEEFRTLNLCLDDAIAGAVTEYARAQERSMGDAETERLGSFSHELRNHLSVALLSFDTIKQGLVGTSGSTGAVHGRALMRLHDLVDRSLAEVRLDAGVQQSARVSVAGFIEEVEIGAAIEARAKNVDLTVGLVDPTLFVDADRQTLASAVSNLLQNAIKFTPARGLVALTTRAAGDRVLIEVEDECGGLPAGRAEDLFRPFEQRGADRTGLGLGLSICMRAAKANGGALRVRDIPGKGCVFTVDLPRKPAPSRA